MPVEDFAIAFENAGFSYDGDAYAFRSLNLRIAQGQLVALVGGNGSGKSTIAKHVNALLTPQEGRVLVFGRDTRSARARKPREQANTSTSSQRQLTGASIREQVGLVMQNPDDQLVASIVEDEVAFGPENLGVKREELRERVSAALETVDLAGFERRAVHTLSGGQKQRLAVAGALAMRPRVLVLDEATSMLDPRGRAELLRTVRTLHAEGMTVLMITHFMDEAALADRVVVLKKGRVLLDGSPREVLSRAGELADTGLETPLACRVSQKLRACGIRMPVCLSASELCQSVLKLEPLKEGTLAVSACNARDTADAGSAAEANDATSAGDATTPPPAAHTSSPAPANASPTPTPASTPLLAFDHVSFAYDAPSQRSKATRRNHRSKAHAPKCAERGLPANTRESTCEPLDTSHGSPQASDMQKTDWVLHGVSLEVHEGELVGVAGHTGSGKSTLLRLANALARPTCGRVLFQGADTASKQGAAKARRAVGMAFQQPEQQLFAATVYDDVAFAPRNTGLSSAQVDARVREALERVGLSFADVAHRSPFELSGGQRRRAALAGVLAANPQVLVLDEPAAGLDPAAHAELIALIQALNKQGLAILMASHFMDDLALLASRIVVLGSKAVRLCGTPEQVFARADELESLGLGLPAAHACACALREAGVSLPQPLYNEQLLVRDLMRALGKQ